jgi:LytS/YehU family sensor histidine kinase
VSRPAKPPLWLLIPIGFGLLRARFYGGSQWWLLVGAELLVDVATVYALVQLAERYPLGRRLSPGGVWPHAAAAIAYATTSIALEDVIIAHASVAPQTEDSLLHRAMGELVAFVLWSGLAHAIVYLRRFRATEARSLQLRLDLARAARQRAEAELRSFENELNPRFLIDSLRSAASHAQSDPARGERLLVEIADVVRAARRASRSATLGDEIDALTPFLALERDRLGHEITLTARVADELLDEPVPPMVLPALIRESLRTASGAVAIDISASVEQGLLRVDVTQAADRRPTAAADDGVLARTMDHLRKAYAGEASIDVSRAGSGVRVRLSVPVERASAPDENHPAAAALAPALPRRSHARAVWLAAWFVTLAALNIYTALTVPRFNGIIPPPGLAIAEALHAAASATLILYVALRLTRLGAGPRMLAAHGGAALGLGLAVALTKWMFGSMAGSPYAPGTLAEMGWRTVAGAMMYGFFAGIIGAFEYARRHRDAEVKGLQMRAELAEADRRRIEAELRALKAELNPHFVGNALAGASSVIHTDPAAAGAMLTQLADVVGGVVARVGTQEVTLQEEMDGLAPFIAVEQSRFGQRLTVQWNVDEDVRTARVPHLILQPLVENAVKHGLAAPRGGHIVVGGRRAGERLELTVRDDGVGLDAAKRARHVGRTGIGLSNSRARLEQLYGSDATIQLEPAPDVGTVVRVTLPWR